MFGKKLQQENENLKEELYMLQQLVEDVAEEMMALELDSGGLIQVRQFAFPKRVWCRQ